ncbi:ketosteroid isomerase-related protein [Sphingopyxis macrogoltabida]|uniref:Isopropylmalate/homocitrate/citramalate synthase n=1 Tax=Sphingopyxis macrogoltabida TaxID=33050 RepID=A0AAC8Z210_SPHMC|nr:ketosteroid isomerase-related protein [Sphingopyxis macrogoltabida]ALJ14149.1 isopropylmalate/homocitrate/citramalate synthase [Sphingopyxis macrogoltabida]AMU90415.1 isopropylmalate/homocitrate/citramalate synthase [Sphingopyxis macrogoltabida]
MTTTRDIVTTYYAAFNAGDSEAMLACLAEDVRHDVNQGDPRHGKALFREFNAHMAKCYREQLTDMVIFAEADRAAAEFIVNGTYLATDEGLPEANGQIYRLPGGAFLSVNADGLIDRVTTYYNLTDWMRQVGA